MPSTPFSGVRISWLIAARNCDLARFEASAAALARVSSRSARVMSRITLTVPPSGVRRSITWITLPSCELLLERAVAAAMVRPAPLAPGWRCATGVGGERQRAGLDQIARSRRRRRSRVRSHGNISR